MTRVPPELDGLMWAIAEEANSNAAEEFIRRYPVYRDELIRRQTMVAGLRSGKPVSASLGLAPSHSIPKFTPREVRRVAPEPRQVGIASMLVLAAIATATYMVASNETRPATDPRDPPIESPHVEVPAVSVAPGIADSLPRPDRMTAPAPPPTLPSVPSKADRPQTLIVKRAGLKGVLQLLGQQSGLTIVLAPGMPNPDVAVEYHDLTPMEILKDLGNRYRFTAFDQGDGSIVVYPAIDSQGEAGAGVVRRIGA